MSATVRGFEPFFDRDSKVLILGSFPSVKSREQAFYYGNPRNSFWRIIATFFKEELPLTVQDKKLILTKHNLALWDIVTECEITASRDDTIKNYKVADLDRVLKSSAVRTIIVNGGTAAKIFDKHYKNIGAEVYRLPSTSPANTGLNEELWYDALCTAFRRA